MQIGIDEYCTTYQSESLPKIIPSYSEYKILCNMFQSPILHVQAPTLLGLGQMQLLLLLLSLFLLLLSVMMTVSNSPEMCEDKVYHLLASKAHDFFGTGFGLFQKT